MIPSSLFSGAPRAIRALLLAAALLASAAAFADDPPTTPPPGDKPPEGLTLSPKDRATALAKEGSEYARNGQYAEAASKFQQSVLVFPMTDVYYNLAYVYEQLGEWKGCVDNYGTYLERFKAEHDGADPPEVAAVKRSIEKCRETAQPPVSVSSTPDGARVALNDRDRVVGTTPFEMKLDPGTYTLFLLKDGFQPVETKIVVEPKQPGKFHFELRPIVNTGKVRINVNVRDANIFIDGKNVGISPYLETPELEVGRHQIVVKKEDYTSVNQTFEIAKGETRDLDLALFLSNPPPSWRSYLGWTGIALGAVSIAGGVVSYYFADLEFNDTEDFELLSTLQTVGYSVGGSLLGIGIGLVVWEGVMDRVNDDDLIQADGSVPEAPRVMPLANIQPLDEGFFISGGVRF